MPKGRRTRQGARPSRANAPPAEPARESAHSHHQAKTRSADEPRGIAGLFSGELGCGFLIALAAAVGMAALLAIAVSPSAGEPFLVVAVLFGLGFVTFRWFVNRKR